MAVCRCPGHQRGRTPGEVRVRGDERVGRACAGRAEARHGPPPAPPALHREQQFSECADAGRGERVRGAWRQPRFDGVGRARCGDRGGA